jgi:hypothetical protein
LPFVSIFLLLPRFLLSEIPFSYSGKEDEQEVSFSLILNLNLFFLCNLSTSYPLLP